MLANKVWRNITIRQNRQTLIPPNFRRLRYTTVQFYVFGIFSYFSINTTLLLLFASTSELSNELNAMFEIIMYMKNDFLTCSRGLVMECVWTREVTAVSVSDNATTC